MNAPPMVTTPHLTGRRVQQDDLEYVIETDSDIRIQRWLSGRVQTAEESRERHVRWMQGWNEVGFGFWIFSDAAGAAVGHGGIFRSPREEGEIEVGYALKPDHWGHGFATEITRLSLTVGFERVGLRRIIGIAQAANLASRRVMEKCGMVIEVEMPSPDGINGVRYAIETNRGCHTTADTTEEDRSIPEAAL
jgi:[ribosomal protein S5]-alanine N-acetyltransferase